MNKYIQKLIQEQFNIGNMDLNNTKPKRNTNIFNKELNHPYYYNVLNGTVIEDEIKELNSLVSVAVPKDKNELRKIIEFYSKNYPEDSLNWLDVSGITDMSYLFKETVYNGDISKWDTSNVINMEGLFNYAYKFNTSIDDWDVSNVTNMCCMFCNAWRFDQPIGDWDVSSVTDMECMFDNAEIFDWPIGDWDVSSVTNMKYMFISARIFNQPIGDWDVSNVNNMYHMFYSAESFNQDISNWNISDETDIDEMFENCPIEEECKPLKCKYYNYE